MSINLSTFWTTWGVSSGDTTSTNQYDFWRGLIMTGGTRMNSQYDFFTFNNTTRYQFFKNLNSTYPEVWDEYTFYQNTNDARIYDFNTFYTYAAQSLPGGTPPIILSGSIAPISAYTNTNIILTGSSNYTGSTFIWGLSNFRNTTGGTITSYTGNPLIEGYFISSGNSNVNLTITAEGQTATTSTFDVYTLPSPMNASGGTITTITADTKVYKVHTFLSGGTFNVTSLGTTSGQVEYLIVGGGGGGGATYGAAGGGGAGGFVTGDTNVSVSAYTITIGNGGAGGDINRPLVSGSTGNNSSFANIIAYGGGGGGAEGAGANGGSGGGGSGGGPGTNAAGGTAVAGQGYSGGTGYGASYGDRAGAGGGGAGVKGTDAVIDQAGSGGNGLQTAINGTLTYYAGGGAGGGNGIPGQASGGLGGGGSSISNSNGQPGQANTGGGGAGGDHQSGADKYGGDGGSGIVIIRYEIF